MRLGRPEASEVRSLSRWERVGVRGYGVSLEQRARFAVQIDLSPPGRGKANAGRSDPIKGHLALASTVNTSREQRDLLGLAQAPDRRQRIGLPCVRPAHDPVRDQGRAKRNVE